MNNTAKLGGILSIIAGSFGVFYLALSLFFIYLFKFMAGQPEMFFPAAPQPDGTNLPDAMPPEFLTFMSVFFLSWGIGFALTGILAVIGGISALNKKRWGLALVGAIAGTITFLPVGIPAIIYTTLAKPEFSRPAQSEAPSAPQ